MLITILIGSPNAAITGFNSPYDVAVSPNHNYIYVTNNGNNTVSIVDAATNTITETITGFNRPEGIAITPNGAFAYVADLGTNELVRIDTSTNSITEITGGFDLPYYVSISPDGKTAYVTNQGNNTVSVVDLTSQFGLSIPTITPSNAVFDADQNMPFKSTWFGGRPPYAGNWIIFQGSNKGHNNWSNISCHSNPHILFS
jgi:YVTN family beta-propeller protein